MRSPCEEVRSAPPRRKIEHRDPKVICNAQLEVLTFRSHQSLEFMIENTACGPGVPPRHEWTPSERSPSEISSPACIRVPLFLWEKRQIVIDMEVPCSLIQ